MKKKVFILLFVLFSIHAIVHGETIINPYETYTYDKLNKDLIALDQHYGHLLQVKKIGSSHFGRKIYAVKLGKGKEHILIVGSHHGREWLSTSIMMRMMETYADAYKNNRAVGLFHPKIFDDISIWFVPMLNPDGVTIQQGLINEFPLSHRGRLMKMNENWIDFSRWKANGHGIDLNRQYPAGWKKLNKEPAVPYYQFYKGKRPLEAAEVAALTKFTKKEQPLIAIAYHTAGREIYWNYKNGRHQKRDRSIAENIAFITGYKLANPSKNAIGGGYTDWFITTFKRPAMTIELSYLVGETNPPLTVFEEEWSRNELVGIMLAYEAKKLNLFKKI
ncbi:carboxypeptidase [Bacillus aquiflavi]|uniref:Carboxypeptidase n=1 Tax=Bacillus aquiflavi TaxID=2672567 RepID=A0A6B3VUJ9_9BACI|nr:M14 family zinc carboxypeptidase [Bacillus aquiflavi]MBA4535611.1 carboxypeptidase [Bacillus aquiflavi]NEY79987.1 carboxypeptidase [Bacillus aquiflavi]